MQKIFHKGCLMLCLQLACWLFLVFFLPILIPVVSATLFEGMVSWNTVSIFFCFGIEYVIIQVMITQRESLVRKAKKWLQTFSRKQIRWVLLLCNALAYGWWLRISVLLFAYLNSWSFAIVLQWFVLSGMIWALCGMAVPMSARRYWGWFRRPEIVREKRDQLL